MKVTLVITTINKPNKNIELFCRGSKKNNWNFEIIGDRKSPKYYKINYGNFYSIADQKKLSFKFPSICPENSYSRKNIGYLISMKKGSNVIIETDDDNIPKKNFFKKKKLTHITKEIKDTSWINIYNNFLLKKEMIWPRGLPFKNIQKNSSIKKKYIKSNFYLQQGVCEGNPDVDSIFRLTNKKINIKFKKNYKVSLGKSISPFNSQNTIWFKKIFPLMYLPVTCTMRCTDIWRSLIALKILNNEGKKILFFGTTMFQKRNKHNLINDLKDELPMFVHSEKIIQIIKKLKLKKGEKFYFDNLLICYKALVKNKIFEKSELYYLKAWIKDCRKIAN